jgi:ornithine--oxo-acid transaminase
MVADEVQTGMGRTGKLLATWHEEVEADMYIFGKALSGGFYPISAIATDSRIMDVFTPGSHGSTFGGNPLAATVGLAAIKVIKEEKLAERAKEMGNYLYEKIKNLNPKKVKEVRAKGLMLGIEFHEDAGHAHDYALELVEKGVLCKDTHDTTLRFAPPLVCGEEEIDFLAKAILEVVS